MNMTPVLGLIALGCCASFASADYEYFQNVAPVSTTTVTQTNGSQASQATMGINGAGDPFHASYSIIQVDFTNQVNHLFTNYGENWQFTLSQLNMTHTATTGSSGNMHFHMNPSLDVDPHTQGYQYAEGYPTEPWALSVSPSLFYDQVVSSPQTQGGNQLMSFDPNWNANLTTRFRSNYNAGVNSYMTLFIAADSGLKSEFFGASGGTPPYFDFQVEHNYGDPIPAPGALALLGLAGAATRRRRR